MFQPVKRMFFKNRETPLSWEKYWNEKAKETDAEFDKLLISSRENNVAIPKKRSRESIYDITLEDEFDDESNQIQKRYKPEEKKKAKLSLWQNVSYGRQEKNKFFKTRTTNTNAERKGSKDDRNLALEKSRNISLASNRFSSTSRLSSDNRRSYSRKNYCYPQIISDISSAEDDTYFEVTLDKNYNRRFRRFVMFDAKQKLANEFWKKANQKYRVIANNHIPVDDNTKSTPPKKKYIKHPNVQKQTKIQKPRMTYAEKLQRERDCETLRAVLEDDSPISDLNALSANKDVLNNRNLLPVHNEQEQQLFDRNYTTMRVLPTRSESMQAISLEEIINNEENSITPPIPRDSNVSYLSAKRGATSTPIVSKSYSDQSISASPIESSEKKDRSSAAHAESGAPPIKNTQTNAKQILKTKRIQDTTQLGFPNPPGTNKCWMNSALQAILGMNIFVDDIDKHVQTSNILKSGTKYSMLIGNFIGVFKAKQSKNKFQLHEIVGKLYESSAVLNEHFKTHNQEDIFEFLSLFFDALRKEFNQSYGSNETSSCRNNEYQWFENPIHKNIFYKQKEMYSCVKCSNGNSKVTENSIFYVNIPSELNEIKLQNELDRSMMTESRDLCCENCDSQQFKVKTLFTVLPRFLIFQVSRFKVNNGVAAKLSNHLKIPINLLVKNVMHDELRMPAQWIPNDQNRILSPKEMDSCFHSSQNSNKDVEFHSSAEQILPHPKHVKDGLEYRLLSIISHIGHSINSGHYEAHVYHMATRKWIHYNDLTVTDETEEEAVGLSQQKNAYALVYLYMPLFKQCNGKSS